MRKSTTVRQVPPAGLYHELLIEKRQAFLSRLGAGFDTIASFGRVAEEDQAKITHDEFVSLRLNRMEYNQLRLVEQALDRLSSGDYGVCLGCDEPIPSKRLRAVPWAQYCVECQEKTSNDFSGEPAEPELRFTPVAS